MIDVLVPGAAWAVLTLIAAVLAWEMVRSARHTEGQYAFPDRWGVLGRAVPVVLFTAFTLLSTQWLVVPAALWWVNVAAATVGLAAGAARWPALPWSADDDRARGRRIGALLLWGLAVAVVLFLVL